MDTFIKGDMVFLFKFICYFGFKFKNDKMLKFKKGKRGHGYFYLYLSASLVSKHWLVGCFVLQRINPF